MEISHYTVHMPWYSWAIPEHQNTVLIERPCSYTIGHGTHTFVSLHAWTHSLFSPTQMYSVFCRCKELGALPLVHAENGDLLEAVSVHKFFNALSEWNCCTVHFHVCTHTSLSFCIIHGCTNDTRIHARTHTHTHAASREDNKSRYYRPWRPRDVQTRRNRGGSDW